MHQYQHNSLKGTIFCILSVTSLLLLSKCPAQILYRFVNNDEAYLWPLLCLSATISCLGLGGYTGYVLKCFNFYIDNFIMLMFSNQTIYEGFASQF